MKTFLTLFLLSTFSLFTIAQTHIPASKTLVGIWRQTGRANINTGVMKSLISGNYKVINYDGTFFTFVAWGITKQGSEIDGDLTSVGQYGTYKIISDSTLVEHIVKHMYPRLNGTKVLLKFKLEDENTLIISWRFDKIHWIDEQWSRLPLP